MRKIKQVTIIKRISVVKMKVKNLKETYVIYLNREKIKENKKTLLNNKRV